MNTSPIKKSNPDKYNLYIEEAERSYAKGQLSDLTYEMYELMDKPILAVSPRYKALQVVTGGI